MRVEIPAGHMSWFDAFGLFHFRAWPDYCFDTDWPWWRPTLLEERGHGHESEYR
jgi:hypothetical protein